MAGRQQTVRFFRLTYQFGAQTENPAQIDWPSALDGWTQYGMEGEWIDGILFHPGDQLSLPVLGIHKPTSSDFRSTIDMKEAIVNDLVQDEDDGTRLADSTAVAFLPFSNVIAVARGTSTSPRQGALLAWLNHCAPAPSGRHWSMSTLKDPAKLEQLMGSHGRAKKLTLDYVTGPDLFRVGFDQESGTLLQRIESLGQLLGAEVQVKLEISIADRDSRQKHDAQKRMWEAAAKSAQGLATHSKKADLTIIDEDGRTSLLNLVEQDYAITHTLSYGEEDGYTFSSLQRRLVDIALGAQNTLTQLVGEG